MLSRHIDIFENGIDRTNDLTLLAVDAHLGIDVELRRSRFRMNTGDRTDFDAGAVVRAQASDDVWQVISSPQSGSEPLHGFDLAFGFWP
jgi:hypothetical protein